MSVRAALAAAFAAALACAALAATASASIGPIELQSIGPLDQFEAAYEPAISADGHYLAFEGRLDGVRGIFRNDLHSGQVQLVVGASSYSSGSAVLDASAPSISADGRYVSFTTTAALRKTATVGSNVYVRDMSLPLPSAADGACSSAEDVAGSCAYELASALSGSDLGLAYGAGQGNVVGEGQGAAASGRVALSADGREVVFVTLGVSDFTSKNPKELTTPPLQVFVRYLDRHETVLVSTVRDAGTGAMTEEPVPGGAVTATAGFQAGEPALLPGAALSGDGSTVAWLGAHIPSQAPTLGDEAQLMVANDNALSRHYDEPLWRRIATGSNAPTRRVVGGGDPLAPGCPTNGTLATAECRGPFPELAREGKGDQESNLGWLSIRGYDGVPQLSADGRRVALIGDPGGTSNVFVVDMQEGLDRLQAVRQLTREIPVAQVVNPGLELQYVASAGDVYDVGISPGGGRIAFTTQRQLFPLAPPNFTETPLSQLGVAELYQVDLSAEGLQRVTSGPGDGPSIAGGSGVTSQGAVAPSYSWDGGIVAFADTASNLVAGDANSASDVFTVTDVNVSSVVGTVSIGAGPSPREPAAPQWRLSVVAVAHPNGTATVDVVVPGAGRVAANATATVPIATPAAGGGGASRARGRAKRRRGTELAHRTVAAASMPVEVPGLLELPLRVASSYTKLLSTVPGIYATLRVTFTGAGGPALSQVLALSLRRLEPKKPRSSARKRRKGKPGGSSR